MQLSELEIGDKFILLRNGKKYKKGHPFKHYASHVKPVNWFDYSVVRWIMNNQCEVERQ